MQMAVIQVKASGNCTLEEKHLILENECMKSVNAEIKTNMFKHD